MELRTATIILLSLLAMLVVAGLLPVLAPGLIRAVDQGVLKNRDH